MEQKLFSNLSVYQSIFKSSSEQYESYRSIINSQNNDSSLVGRSFYSNIIENGAQFITDYSFNSNNRLKVGARIAHQQFKPNIFPTTLVIILWRMLFIFNQNQLTVFQD